MALHPIDETHALQIQAGTIGRKAGHAFEDKITKEINSLNYPLNISQLKSSNVYSGDPALLLLSAIAVNEGIQRLERAIALSTGALATSEEGMSWLNVNGVAVSRCKSDLILTLYADDGRALTIGVSTKQCNNVKPTNAQLYFTTATAFVSLLQANNIAVSGKASVALREFCGDIGFRPVDNESGVQRRFSDSRRYYWEEIDPIGREEWEFIFSIKQNMITRLLLQKAYLNDPFVPTYVLHKTKKSSSWGTTEVAIYSVDNLVSLSAAHHGFMTRPYTVAGATHLAPRFGIVQMQRGGQTQHPTQLQFNLQASYFYKI